MKRVSIVGYGRFGAVLHRLLRDDFDVRIFPHKQLSSDKDIARVYESEVIFYAVPIEVFEQVIAVHKQYFRPEHLLVDVCSVKMHSKRVFEKHLKGMKTQALLTHPMFGPDSSKNGFAGLPLIMDRFRTDANTYAFWKGYFVSKGLSVVELSAREHDRLAANSQGLTHFIGRLLEIYTLKPTVIDSVGAQKLLEVKEQICHDSWQLFANLQHYNPYTAAMRVKLGKAYETLYARLLPERTDPATIVYGIQGGVGSFNEEAIRYYFGRAGITGRHIAYLYTSAKVMRALHEGSIDRGQFAIHNSAGGMVQESIEAMAGYTFRIVDQYAIKIAHALMMRPDATLGDVTTIMTHPQVLAQCAHTLAQKYPQLSQTSGTGVMVDHALVAKALFEKKLPKHVAVMGSKVLAELYGLQIVEDNLQDLTENYTTFLQVARRS